MAQVYASSAEPKFRTVIRTAHHEIISDEPLENGGHDTGFAPGELLAASLAACTSITLRMYAGRKNWPLLSVEVEVRVERDEATKETHFQRYVKLSGPLDSEQQERLLQIAEKCPVHQILSHPIHIQTSLV